MLPQGSLLFPWIRARAKLTKFGILAGLNICGLPYRTLRSWDPVGSNPCTVRSLRPGMGPRLGVQVWCPDVLTTYVVEVPKMVCFFEVAFENGLRFPLHPFIKRVMQHFNVCPSLLFPNFWGVLVGLLVVFRDKGLGVPNIALLLDFFSVKEAAEGFLYISKHSNAKLIISNLPSSHKFWKERYFFVSGRHLEYNPFDREDTLGVPAVWTTPKNLCELSFVLVCFGF